MNIPFRKEWGSYTYSLSGRGNNAYGPYLSLIRSTSNNLGEMPPLNLEGALLGEILAPAWSGRFCV